MKLLVERVCEPVYCPTFLSVIEQLKGRRTWDRLARVLLDLSTRGAVSYLAASSHISTRGVISHLAAGSHISTRGDTSGP